MVRVSNIILPPEGDFLLLKKKAARILGVPMGKIHRCVPVRQSIDARKKSDVHYVMTVDVALSGEADVVAELMPVTRRRRRRRKNCADWNNSLRSLRGQRP